MFKAYKEVFGFDKMIIHDPGEQARREIEKSNRKFEAMSILKAMETAGQWNDLGALLRVINGASSGLTKDMIMASLVKVADDNPAAILQIETDKESFQKRSFLAQVVEKGLLTINRDGYYKDRSGATLAKDESDMIYQLDQDKSLKEALARQLRGESLTQKIEVARTGEVSAQSKAVFDDVLSISEEVPVNELTPSDVLLQDQEELTEEHIESIVAKAIDISYFEPVGANKFKYLGESYNKKQLMAFFTKNVREAQSLEETLNKIS